MENGNSYYDVKNGRECHNSLSCQFKSMIEKGKKEIDEDRMM